jgi:hypothetical protein
MSKTITASMTVVLKNGSERTILLRQEQLTDRQLEPSWKVELESKRQAVGETVLTAESAFAKTIVRGDTWFSFTAAASGNTIRVRVEDISCITFDII